MTNWLNEVQQQHWRAFLEASSLLPERLSRELQESFGISIKDYEILVRLSETADRRIRMSELATLTLVSRSRLTHQIDRLEKAGHVVRAACSDDARGQWCHLTDKGWELLVAAAPTHVTGVRAHLVDQLTDNEFAALGKAMRKVVKHLESLDN